MAKCWIVCKTDSRFNEEWEEDIDMGEQLLPKVLPRVEKRAAELGVPVPDVTTIECGADAG